MDDIDRTITEQQPETPAAEATPGAPAPGEPSAVQPAATAPRSSRVTSTSW